MENKQTKACNLAPNNVHTQGGNKKSNKENVEL